MSMPAEPTLSMLLDGYGSWMTRGGIALTVSPPDVPAALEAARQAQMFRQEIVRRFDAQYAPTEGNQP